MSWHLLLISFRQNGRDAVEFLKILFRIRRRTTESISSFQTSKPSIYPSICLSIYPISNLPIYLAMYRLSRQRATTNTNPSTHSFHRWTSYIMKQRQRKECQETRSFIDGLRWADISFSLLSDRVEEMRLSFSRLEFESEEQELNGPHHSRRQCQAIHPSFCPISNLLIYLAIYLPYSSAYYHKHEAKHSQFPPTNELRNEATTEQRKWKILAGVDFKMRRWIPLEVASVDAGDDPSVWLEKDTDEIGICGLRWKDEGEMLEKTRSKRDSTFLVCCSFRVAVRLRMFSYSQRQQITKLYQSVILPVLLIKSPSSHTILFRSLLSLGPEHCLWSYSPSSAISVRVAPWDWRENIEWN